VPGLLLFIREENPNPKWKRVTKTPALVTPEPGLRYLLSVGRKVEDADLEGLAALREFTALKSLQLTGCKKVTDAGLKHLRALEGIEYLFLDGCKQLTEAGISHIQGLSQLK